MAIKEKEHKRFYSNPGSRLADKHQVRIDNLGHKTLVKTGEKTNIYAKIQSHVDECDIEKILTRAQVEGYDILNQREAIQGDVTMVPHSMLEAAIMLQDQENAFNQLPLDIRKEFNYSFTEYIATASNDVKSWATKMGMVEKETPVEPLPTTPTEGGEE